MSGETPKEDPIAALDFNAADRLVTIAKALAGIIPYVGSPISEIVSVAIPKQRMGRVVDFVKKLDGQVAELERELLKLKESERFCEFFYEILRQVAYSTSENRITYLVSLVERSLSDDEVKLIEARQLLALLGELNDLEVLWLKYYENPPATGETNQFFEQHKDVFQPIAVQLSSSKEEHDKAAFQKSYKLKLSRLGLIEDRFKLDRKTGQPVVETSSGKMKSQGYLITSLGELLLRRIGLAETDKES